MDLRLRGIRGQRKRTVFMSRGAVGVCLLCALAFSAGARAQSPDSQAPSTAAIAQGKQPIPEYIQEFFLSEAVRNQDQGDVQITVGGDSRRDVGSNVALDLEYGITNRLQLSSETEYGFSATANAEIPAGWSMEFNGRRLNGENGFYVTPWNLPSSAASAENGRGMPVGLGGIAGRIGIVGKGTWESGGEEQRAGK